MSVNEIQNYRIERINNSNEFALVIYLDDFQTEFASELGVRPEKKQNLVDRARTIVHDQYPKLKVSVVKVVLGGLVLTSFQLGEDSEKASAQSPSQDDTNVQQTENNTMYYQVTPGDTLWGLAKKYNTTVQEIRQANNLVSDTLSINQRLLMPKAVHTVKTGDYLSILARDYGTTVWAIREANNLKNDTVLLGQKLIIPADLSKSTDSTPPAPTIQSYQVQANDTLYSIAKRFGVTIEEVRTTNNLTTDILSIGQVLTIPNAVNKGESAKAPEPVKKDELVTPPATTVQSHTVQAGDTLYSIAKRFGVTVDEVRTINNLISDILSIGQVLNIQKGANAVPIAPNKDEANKAPMPSAPSQEAVNKAPTPAPPPVTNQDTNIRSHTVVAGDTLYSLANRFGVSVDALRNTNNLKSDNLSLGQIITIPTVTPSTPSSPPPAKEEARTTFDYRVVSGDTLSAIASRFGVTVENIKKENNLKSDSLQIGQVLTISNGTNAPATKADQNTITYKTHTIASGDNIWDLSVRYGIPQAELLKANNLTTSSRLSIGQKIKIPVHQIAVKETVSSKHGELLDWWTEAQYVFAIGKTAKVTDLATGKSFNIKRTVGANHADSETVTQADTNTAKSIWGGFSWKTRAVILEVDGRKLAASMSFMPHEREYVANNGITGHFDVYFSNSTRHVDGKPDPLHQAQVEKAAGIR